MSAPPEFVSVGGKLGVKVSLCGACAGKLRGLVARSGGQLRTLDIRVLCEQCRPSAEAEVAFKRRKGAP